MSRIVPQLLQRPRPLAALIAFGALTGAAMLAAAPAATAAQVYETTVYYNLFDLATDQGTRAVYRRIVNAAEAVCPAESSVSLSDRAASKECQQQAVARAVDQIGNARLAAVHARASTRHG